MMLKAIAIYRDSSKLSQPLNSSVYDDLDEVVMLGDEETLDETIGPKQVQDRIIEKVLYKAQRRRLPKKRKGFIREAYVESHKVYLRTGEYEDGALGEIFIDMYKEGASFRGLLNSFAILASKALQYGVPLEELVDTFTFTRFEPAGIVNGHEAIKQATSILDYVFRSLGYDYLNRSDFVHVKAVDEIPQQGNASNTENLDTPLKTSVDEQDLKVKPNENSTSEDNFLDETEGFDLENFTNSGNGHKAQTSTSEAKRIGYTGEQCLYCGSIRVRRNGSCTVCEDCGGTSGCS